MYDSFGLFDRAIELLERSLSVRRQVVNNDDRDLANTRRDLASAVFQTGREQQAIGMMREVVSSYRRMAGGDDPDLAECLQSLGYMLAKGTERHEAEPYLREAVDMSRRLYGNESREVAQALQLLAYQYYANRDQHHIIEIVEPALEALDIQRRVLGEDRLEVGKTLSLLGMLKFDTNEYDAAIDYHLQAIAIQRKFTDLHPSLGTMLCNLAFAHLMKGESEAAEACLLDALPMMSGLDRAVALKVLGHAYCDRGQPALAELVFRECLALCETACGQGDVRTLDAQEGLARSLRAQGRHHESSEVHWRVLPIAEKLYGPDHSILSYPLHGLGLDLMKSGRYPEAEWYLRRALAIRVRGFAPGYHAVVDSRRSLAECLLAQGCRDETIETLAGHFEPAEMLSRFARSLKDRGQPQDAVEFFEAALTRAETVADQVAALVGLGDTYRGPLGRPKDAESHYCDALELARKEFGDRHLKTHQAASGLAWTLNGLNRLDEAAALFEQQIRICDEWLGPEDRESAGERHGLGLVLRKRDGSAAAEPILRKALSIRQRHLPEGHHDIAWVMLDWAECLAGLGRYEEARRGLHEGYQGIQKKFGPESSQARGVARRVITFHDSRGDLARAVKWRNRLEAVSEAVVRRHEKDGTSSSEGDLLNARRDLAECLVWSGRLDDALAIIRRHDKPSTLMADVGWRVHGSGRFEDAHALFQEALNDARGVPERVNALRGIASALGALSAEPEELEPYFQEVLAPSIEAFGLRDDRTQHAFMGLAMQLVQMGRADEALLMCHERWSVCQEWVGADGTQTINARFGIGRALLELGRPAEAEPQLRAALESRERRLPPEHWDIAAAQLELGRCLAAMGCYDEAELFLVASLPPLTNRFGTTSRHARRSLEALVALEEASGRPNGGWSDYLNELASASPEP